MHPGLSLYLDLLRLLAAMEVVAFHLGTFPLLAVGRDSWNAYGHEAVTVFFVLSGFVIRHAAGKDGASLRSFAIGRISRVYSVAIPCLVLTLLFDWIGRAQLPDLYKGLMVDGSPLALLAIGGLMLNEAWSSNLMLSNIPYWSISYEFWYYWLFAALFFLRGWQRWLFALLVMAIAGPNILAMAPIWAMGWWAYRWRDGRPVSSWAGWLLFLQPVAVFAAYAHFDWVYWNRQLLAPILGFREWHVGMSFSRFVLSDTLLGASIAVHLLGARAMGPVLLRVLQGAGGAIRQAAGHSFTLYLLHQPALLVMGAIAVPYCPPSWRGWVVAAGMLVIVWLVSKLTETQRHRLNRPVGIAIDGIVSFFQRLKARWMPPGIAAGV